MKTKHVITGVLLAFVGASVVVLAYQALSSAKASDAIPTPPLKDGVVVYYFHGDKRCDACLSLERGARAAVESAFAGPVAEGRMVFASVNRNAPGYDRLAEQYQLAANSVVLVEVAGGAQVRWKNLDAVWDYAGDDAALFGYVSNELTSFMAGS